MRSKHILGLITFIAAFAFSAFVALLFAAPKVYQVPPVPLSSPKTYDGRCNKRLGDKIEEFLNQDKRNGYERRRYDFSDEGEFVSRSSIAEQADSITEYASKSGAMDASGFPSDFQAAWDEHMTAWSNYADFMQKSKNKRMTAEDLYQQKNSYVDEINSTWFEVLITGRKYGADLPEGF
jgi:hypothetical protein